jgi:hypothetical protein
MDADTSNGFSVPLRALSSSPRKVERDDELFDTMANRESQREGDAECRSLQMIVKTAFKLSL